MSPDFFKHVVYCKGADLRPGMLVFDLGHTAINGGLFKLVHTYPAYEIDDIKIPAQPALTPYGWWPKTKLGLKIDPAASYQVLSPDNWSISNLGDIE